MMVNPIFVLLNITRNFCMLFAQSARSERKMKK